MKALVIGIAILILGTWAVNAEQVSGSNIDPNTGFTEAHLLLRDDLNKHRGMLAIHADSELYVVFFADDRLLISEAYVDMEIFFDGIEPIFGVGYVYDGLVTIMHGDNEGLLLFLKMLEFTDTMRVVFRDAYGKKVVITLSTVDFSTIYLGL